MNYQRVKIEMINFLPFMTLFGHNKINQPSQPSWAYIVQTLRIRACQDQPTVYTLWLAKRQLVERGKMVETPAC